MKINVVNRTERLELGNIIELRGNFVEKTDEEGNVSYECDMYRTRNKNATFEQLDNQAKIQEAKEYLKDFDYVENKILRNQLKGIDILDIKSDKIDMTYREILEEKERLINLINTLEDTQNE